MARVRIVFRCSDCGGRAPQWVGRCPACGEWNTLIEDRDPPPGGRPCPGPGGTPVPIHEVDGNLAAARATGVDELDRVLGGGLVPGSVTLVGGEPGVGKSTLLLQAAAAMAVAGSKVLYLSAEESPAQVGRRAERLGLRSERLWVASEASVDGLLSHLDDLRPDAVVVDSIQTVHDPSLGSAAGSVTQVRECTALLVREAKRRSMSVILVGHVTKDGALAGPRVLEHLVDTVITFDGDRHLGLRLLRAVKHRFGATDELGLMQMTGRGLEAVADPSQVFLSDRSAGVSGSVVVPALAGHRPLLVEVQALTVRSSLPAPRRSTPGLDSARLAVLLAVLDRRCGLASLHHDIYALAVGGVKLIEPAADLALALAVASALEDVPVSREVVAVGEVGLAGELRQVAQLERRLIEAARLGFARALVPGPAPVATPAGLEVVPVGSLAEALVALGLSGADRDTPGRRPAARRSGDEGPPEPILRTVDVNLAAVGHGGRGLNPVFEPAVEAGGRFVGADDQTW